jgi:hypothetical protein
VTRARAARRTGSTRDRALLTLPYGTGLRLAEATALDVDDVPTTERTGAVHVRAGQGERPRTVPLPADARSLLRRWLTERANHPAAQRGEPALWLGRRGRLSARQLQRIVAELGADARLVDVSAHTLRHTAATRWLRAGVDVVVVAGLLGHASLWLATGVVGPSGPGGKFPADGSGADRQRDGGGPGAAVGAAASARGPAGRGRYRRREHPAGQSPIALSGGPFRAEIGGPAEPWLSN